VSEARGKVLLLLYSVRGSWGFLIPSALRHPKNP